jgi:hypothetical protein
MQPRLSRRLSTGQCCCFSCERSPRPGRAAHRLRRHPVAGRGGEAGGRNPGRPACHRRPGEPLYHLAYLPPRCAQRSQPVPGGLVPFQLIQTTILALHRAGGRGGAPHPPATEGPHWGMGGVRTDGAGFPEPEGIGRGGQDPRLCNKITDVCIIYGDCAVPRGRDHCHKGHRSSSANQVGTALAAMDNPAHTTEKEDCTC